MFSRELEIRSTQHGRVRFHLRGGEFSSESEVERELLAIAFAVDPSLEEGTGRLAPGWLASQVTTNLFVDGPNAEGLHHLGGIECSHEHAATVARLAEQRGFRVVNNA